MEKIKQTKLAEKICRTSVQTKKMICFFFSNQTHLFSKLMMFGAVESLG